MLKITLTLTLILTLTYTRPPMFDRLQRHNNSHSVNQKADFFYKTNRFESIRITTRIDFSRELECFTW